MIDKIATREIDDLTTDDGKKFSYFKVGSKVEKPL